MSTDRFCIRSRTKFILFRKFSIFLENQLKNNNSAQNMGMHLIYPQNLVYPQILPDLWIYSDQQKCSRNVFVFVKKTNILFFFTSFAQVLYRYLAPLKVPIASKKLYYHQDFSARFCAERSSIIDFIIADFVAIEQFIFSLIFWSQFFCFFSLKKNNCGNLSMLVIQNGSL